MAAGLDRRLTPRPLPGHLAAATLLWTSSRAALTSWPAGWPSSSEPARAVAAPLSHLVGEIARHGADAVVAALDRELGRRAAAFLTGLETYRHHPYRRPADDAPVLWRHGTARLLDYGEGSIGPAVMLVPSLINRHHILDLLPERSFVRYLAAAGLRPLMLDWGEPGEVEREMTLGDYIGGRLCEALARVAAGGRVALAGYCMGGLLALAAALRRPADIGCLALLATPWDFHAERREEAQLLAAVIDSLSMFLGADEPVPVSIIQSLFLALDPFLAERKFVRLAGLDPESEAARDFVALEDWINDGVPLARQVAVECARSWYRDNHPARGTWQVAGEAVRPEAIAVPALVVVPRRDRIVPPASAAPLAAVIPNATVLTPSFGHIGMMASADAPDTIWRPIAEWLRAQLL